MITKDKKQPDPKSKNPPQKLSDDSDWGEFMKTAFIAVIIALLIRTFFYEPFNIPSGSMKPTLLIGDYLFVSKPAYGYSRHSFPFGIANFDGRVWGDLPKRGDIAVFKLPTDPSLDYIKRIVGMPGDKIQVIHGILHINDAPVQRQRIGVVEEQGFFGGMDRLIQYVETLPGGATHYIYEESDEEALDNTDAYIVPPKHYFVMGDNRDNSRDSRVMDLVGFVPLDNFVGRADRIFFSTNGTARIYEIWKWPWTVRYERILSKIKNGS